MPLAAPVTIAVLPLSFIDLSNHSSRLCTREPIPSVSSVGTWAIRNHGRSVSLAQPRARCCPGHHSNRAGSPLLLYAPETCGSTQRISIGISGHGVARLAPALCEAATLRGAMDDLGASAADWHIAGYCLDHRGIGSSA